ncbi:beta-1,4-glucuronyltransferase 1-like [Drosophila montana]|uniref:beta-1,4-glucuronyltransferase 1-like n=1 Tax=Drosophila montana TaxID=40370 RepID=UPI00313ADDC4
MSLYMVRGESTAEIQRESENPDEATKFLQLRININCTDRDNVYEKKLHSNYWTLVNYVPAEHGSLRCSMCVTYSTHGDYRYLNNVAPLVERWQAPISLALYAPGTDFDRTVSSILWLRQCDPQWKLIRKWVSFHIYFNVNHIPRQVYKQKKLLAKKIKCTEVPPFGNVSSDELYRNRMELKYPINVGRNIAREAAVTHYVLSSDIELYPSPGLANGFLLMLTANRHLLNATKPIVFTLNIFEVEANGTVPTSKKELKYQLNTGQAIPFHKEVASEFNMGPNLENWIQHVNDSDTIRVFSVNKRIGYWDPIYIGTKQDPGYDERLSWEGMYDKETHSYALCLMGYQFYTLDNAFLVHRPGINQGYLDAQRSKLAKHTRRKLRRQLTIEYILKYGIKLGCRL